MRASPLAINDLEPPDCFSYALNSVNLTIPAWRLPEGFVGYLQTDDDGYEGYRRVVNDHAILRRL